MNLPDNNHPDTNTNTHLPADDADFAEQGSEPQRLSPAGLILPGVGLGVLMIGLATVIGLWRGDRLPYRWYPNDVNLVLELGIGIVLGLLGAKLMMVLTVRFKALGRIRDRLLSMIRLEDVTLWQAVALGLLAGIPEEILFRGAIQPSLGLVLTALLFGAVHAITPMYIFYASLAGLILGGLADWRGDLYAATAAHFAYDAGLFWWMMQDAKERLTKGS